MSEDRRARRHSQTVQEILDVAVQVMAEEGVAALSLSEVARRVGIRPPSLYQYFPSRMAIYDALFERGAREVTEILAAFLPRPGDPPMEAIDRGQRAWLAWASANPVLAQLLYWRPVPGFDPSPRAYAPAERQFALLGSALGAAVEAGLLAPEAVGEDGIGLYLSLMAGILTQ